MRNPLSTPMSSPLSRSRPGEKSFPGKKAPRSAGRPWLERFPGLKRWILPLLFLTALHGGVASAQLLDAEEIIALLKAGVSEEVILYKINESGDWLELTPKEILNLREAGASDKFILEALKSTDKSPEGESPVEERTAGGTGVTLVVHTSPPGANLIIDGVPVEGKTPFIGNRIGEGRHEIYISKKYYRPLTKRITAKVGDKIRIDEALVLERLGVSVGLLMEDLPAGSQWAVRGLDRCAGGGVPVRRDDAEDGRIVLRSAAGKEFPQQSTCVEIYFWTGAVRSLDGTRAPRPDAVFRVEGLQLDPKRLVSLDLLVAREKMSPTGLRGRIVKGSGTLSDSLGGAK